MKTQAEKFWATWEVVHGSDGAKELAIKSLDRLYLERDAMKKELANLRRENTRLRKGRQG